MWICTAERARLLRRRTLGMQQLRECRLTRRAVLLRAGILVGGAAIGPTLLATTPAEAAGNPVQLGQGASLGGRRPFPSNNPWNTSVAGMFVADNGSDWFISGAPDPRWSDADLATLRRVHGSDFEVVQMRGLVSG